MNNGKRSATVIGAGFAGLSVASYLAKAGLKVRVLEKQHEVGGRARYWQSDGYRFDMGPSWYLMPDVFETFFQDIGAKRSDYYELEQLDPYYKIYFGGSDTVTISSDLAATKKVFESLEPGGGEKLIRYLDQARYKYDVAMREFLYRDYNSIFDFLNRRLLTEGLKLHVFNSLDRFVGRYFSDRRAKQILEYAMVFLGTSPADAPALYSIMSHVDLNLGVYYPSGGLAGVSRALGKLAEDSGVEVITGADVTSIDVDSGYAKSVETTEGSYEADIIVSAADYAHTEMTLLPAEARSYGERYWSRRVVAPSMFIAFLGVSKKLPELEHHNLYFSENWNQHFDTIFKTPAWPVNPCYYLSCISKTDTDSAPSGAENLFLLVPVAPGLDDNDVIRERYLDHVLDHVEQTTGVSLRNDIEVKRIYSHRDFSSDYNSFQGTALGLAHTLGQTAVFRPSHRSKKVRNLYYTGQYTHPGIGVPMTLISSRVVADEIKKDMK